jgi:hypothetical protein
MLIRHGEKPSNGEGGVADDGSADADSLIIRGWQRAGALVRFFCPVQDNAGAGVTRPNVVFAAGAGPGSTSRRSKQTVSALATLLAEKHSTPFITNYLKDDIDPMIADVSARGGTALIAWEHSLIPSIAQKLTAGTQSPQPWPDSRFDMVWIFDRSGANWNFTQVPQLLLPGDQA